MSKLYTEKQYEKYIHFLNEIANEDDILKNMQLNSKLEKWLDSNNISDDAVDQMDKRVYNEDTNKIAKLKRIK